MSPADTPEVTVQLGAGTDVRLSARGHGWHGDEPAAKGGSDTGPTPHEQLLGALGSCTALTLRMYARHKSLPLESVEIHYRLTRELPRDCKECGEPDNPSEQPIDVIRGHLVLRGDFTEAQRERLRQVAGRCPVHRTLEGGPRMFETVEFA